MSYKVIVIIIVAAEEVLSSEPLKNLRQKSKKSKQIWMMFIATKKKGGRLHMQLHI